MTSDELGPLVERIRADARSKEASNPHVGDVRRSLKELGRRFEPMRRNVSGSSRLRSVIRQAERLSFIDHHVSTASRKRYLVPVKRGVRSAVSWYVGAIVAQVQDFIRANLQALRAASRAIDALEQRVQRLEEKAEDSPLAGGDERES